MTAKRRICVVTGSRADYGLLRWIMKEIQSTPGLALLTAVTGMHLSPEFGLTFQEIEKDGFRIDVKVDMLLSGDTAAATAKSIGLGVIGFADAFARITPDVVLLLGDRFEIFAAAQAALLARMPIAHIAGGDTTQGAYDEALRHGITKMAHIHFVTNEQAARRVRQLGEDPLRIHNFGSPGIDGIRHLRRVPRQELERLLEFKFLERNILVTFHPATLDPADPGTQFQALLDAIVSLGPEVGVLITRPNADTGGRALNGLIDDFVAAHGNARAYVSLGQHLYLNAMAEVDAVVGNSSSALYEAPTLGIPAVNIGERQKGRPQASSVINCGPVAAEIQRAMREAFERGRGDAVNPYGDGFSASRIATTLAGIEDFDSLLQKRFCDWID